MDQQRLVLRSARFVATQYIQGVLRPGDAAVDATMGNGHDTLMLAQCVAEQGHVDAFDVQESAVAETRGRLKDAGVLSRVSLHLCGHESMSTHIHRPAQAVMFNLGWLPGGDKQYTTRLDTTVTAVRAALTLLAPGGILTLCAYPGHPEGRAELQALVDLFAGLAVQEYNVLHHRFLNHPNDPPELFVVQRDVKNLSHLSLVERK